MTFLTRSTVRYCVFGAALVIGAVFNVPCRSQTSDAELHAQVVDEDSHPVPRVEIVPSSGALANQPLYTDAAGRFEMDFPGAGEVHLHLSKPGFFRIDDKTVDLTPGVNEVLITLNHEQEFEQNIEVRSAGTQIDPETTSHQESLVQHEILNTPAPSSNDLQKNLAIMPQAVIDSSGRLHVAGARQGQTEVLLDGFEINNPGTGAFDSRLNIDAVQSVSLETGGYGAEYAHAGAGVLAISTASGDDQWRFGIANFVPGLNFQRGIRVGTWTPRLTFTGPLKKKKAWFSEALSAQRSLRLVTELPPGQDTEIQWSGDSLSRADLNLSSSNTLHISFLFNSAGDGRMGLGAFAPVSTTTDSKSYRYFGSVKDQILLGHTLFETGVAFDTGSLESTPRGSATYTVTPSSTSGNYFQRTSQNSRRLQWLGNITTGSLQWHGEHTLSAGWNVAGLDFSQTSARSQIDYLRADGTLLERATFSGPASLRMANTQVGGYAQDHWRPFKPVVFAAGVRFDWDRLVQRKVLEPRVALNWMPTRDGRMKLTLAWGIHYQPLNLLILSQGFDQQRSDLFYDATGTLPASSPSVTNFVVPLQSLVQPRSYNTTLVWDEKVFNSTYVGASFLLRELRHGFAYEMTSPPGTFLLQSNRDDRYVAAEGWVRRTFGDRAEFSIDYTLSHASSSEVLDPTLAQLIFSPQQSGPLLWDVRHRVISSGWTPLPIWQLLLSGFFEYHSGFPFSTINQQQQLVGAANGLRFPSYVSLDLGVEKQFRFRGREWAIRVSGINITGHDNPDNVVNRIDAPNYLTFAGGHTRALTGRIRLVTKH